VSTILNPSSSSTASTASSTANQALVLNHQGQIISLPIIQATTNSQAGGNASATSNQSNVTRTQIQLKTAIDDDKNDDQGPTIANISNSSITSTTLGPGVGKFPVY
jgi:hypothetical protein